MSFHLLISHHAALKTNEKCELFKVNKRKFIENNYFFGRNPAMKKYRNILRITFFNEIIRTRVAGLQTKTLFNNRQKKVCFRNRFFHFNYEEFDE